MLITPRTYSASQTPDRAVPDSHTEGAFRFYTLAGWRQSLVNSNPAPDMLLTYQTGSVRVGEVARFVASPLLTALGALSRQTAGFRTIHEADEDN